MLQHPMFFRLTIVNSDIHIEREREREGEGGSEGEKEILTRFIYHKA